MTIKNKISGQYNNRQRQSLLTLIPASKIQIPKPDRKGGDKNKDCIRCFTLLTPASTLSFRLWLLSLIVCILTPLACTETLSEDLDPISILELSLSPSSQNEAPKVVKEPSHFFLAENPTTDLSRQLWQAEISVSKDTKPSLSKNELQQIIKQVESVEFKPQEQTHKPLIVVEPIRKTEPNEISSDTETPQKLQPGKIKRKLPDERVTDQTLEILKTLSQQADQLHDPFELAEILFNSNCLEEAAKYYQQALDHITANETGRFTDKEWILFQIGNCLRNTDPPAAMQAYRQLIVEYPDSQWADLAKAKSKLIDWYLKDKPDAMIKKYKL